MNSVPIEVASDVIEAKMDSVLDNIERYLRRWAVEARGGARMDAPRQTGRLSSSITSKVTRGSEAVTAVIGTNVYYAPHQEYGTGDRGSNDYDGHVSEGVTFTAGWPGIDPHPYLRPQIYDRETEIIAGIQDAVRRGLE
ncbi:MAG: HK97 gp10 family phage protein [Thermoplasmata archaeon]|nr:HK97 gp10 family phage protein [Thermoplasmata archaeon]